MYWRLPGFFNDKSDAPEPYLDISAAIQKQKMMEENVRVALNLKMSRYRDLDIRKARLRSSLAIRSVLSCFENHNRDLYFGEDTTSHSKISPI